MPVWAADDALGGVAGFGALLARTLFVLAAVAALAVLTLRWAAARGIGRAEPGARLVVLARQPIGARQQLLAVQMADRVMLVGASPGRLDRLGEVSASSWAAEEAPATDGASFAALLEGGTP
jgi:flagellar biogenesis protein FliO